MRLDGLEHLLHGNAVARDSDHGYDRVLPGVEVVNFRDGHIEAVTQPVFEAFDNVALLF